MSNPYWLRLVQAKQNQIQDVTERLGMRRKMDLKPIIAATEKILAAVQEQGDLAVANFTQKFDKVDLSPRCMRVSQDEIDQAFVQTDTKLKDALRQAADNILNFHQRQRQDDTRQVSEQGSVVWLKSRPLAKVGVYVPGGTAPLPSSVLMNVLPARAAGVRQIVMCTPPQQDGRIHPAILVAAKIAQVDEIYKVGGAQAIAAMAYGTESIPAVDKIVGPGNIYVNTAKRLVYGQVDIDMFAGPSEILIIADDSASPEYLAADLLSQAEHDRLASAILITDSDKIAKAVQEIVQKKAERLPRRDIVQASLVDYGAILLVHDMTTAVDFANALAPEHLELMVRDHENYLERIHNAGAVFVGAFSPEALGDYWAGANHVLPTSGTARFFSPLHTNQFIKKMNVIEYTRSDLQRSWQSIVTLAKAESLEAHAESVRVRFDEGKY